METRNRDRIIRAFERRVFKYCIMAAIVLAIIRLIQEFGLGAPANIQITNLAFLAILGGIYSFHSRMYRTSVIIFYLLILINALLSWKHTGGWNGPMTYQIILAMISLPFSTQKEILVWLLVAYFVGLMALYRQFELPQHIPDKSMELLTLHLNFFAAIIMLVLFSRYAKGRFNSYRDYVILSNERLTQFTDLLDIKNQKLNSQREELSTIRGNLKELAAAKINEITEKSEKLKGYAFVNAHDVRGPVARILGLISLIEREPLNPGTEQIISAIKSDTQEIDSIIKKINEVIS